jgi:sarcosine oxidase
LEARTGERLLFATGLLSTGRFAERQLPLIRAAGITADLLDPAEAERRYGVHAGGGRAVLHQPDAGVIKANAALQALLRLAGDAGAELRSREAVSRIEAGANEVAVQTDRGVWRARAAVVAAGPWNGRLLAGAGIDVPLAVSRQSVAYFELPREARELPALIDYDGEEPFALPDPGRGLKAALHSRGPIGDPDEQPSADGATLERLRAWVEESFPLLEARPAGSEICLYTNTPDERFILERRGRVVIAAACNGQGFQLAPESGRRAAELALEPAEVSAR